MRSTPGVRSHDARRDGTRHARVFLAASCVCSWWHRVRCAQPQPPELTRPVNDFASVIDADSARQMESLIRSLQETTGDVVVVATIDSLEGEDVNQYAVKMFENRGRGIGQKGKDNGLLVLSRSRTAASRSKSDTTSSSSSPTGSPARRSGRRWRRSSGVATTAPGLAAAVTRIIGRIAEGRNVTHFRRAAGTRVAAARTPAQVETSSVSSSSSSS